LRGGENDVIELQQPRLDLRFVFRNVEAGAGDFVPFSRAATSAR
jgi:hypothetical protein